MPIFADMKRFDALTNGILATTRHARLLRRRQVKWLIDLEPD